MQYQGNELLYSDKSRKLSSNIRNVYEHEGFYYVLLDNGKVNIYATSNANIKLISRLKGTFGVELFFWQNIMLGVDDPGYELGDMTYARLRHCHEIKGYKKQCRNITEEIYCYSYYDALIMDGLPILLLDGHNYLKGKRYALILKRKYEYCPEFRTYGSTSGEFLKLFHANKLFQYNGYIYAVGVDKGIYRDGYGDKLLEPKYHKMVCHIILPCKDELLICEKIISEPGDLCINEAMNKLRFTAHIVDDSGYMRYEFRMERNNPIPYIKRPYSLSDVTIVV